MKKVAFFNQKHELTPLEKCDFWDFQKFLFLLSKKRFVFPQKVFKHFFQSYFDQIQIEKNLAFFDQKHGLTPLENGDFWTLKNFVFVLKKSFFSIQNIIKPYFQSCFDQKQIKKELAFFDQNHGLTPLENCDFWDFKKFCFCT